jgi:DNA-binding CsgD family transcriptional regulator
VFTEAWLPTVDSLVRFFDRHGNANERMMAHYLQGRVHHDMGEAPIALECYQKATEVADTTEKDCDLRTLASVYGQMAYLFHLQYLPDDEMNAIKMAEHYAWKNKDTLSAIIAYVLRTRPLYMRNEMDSVMEIEKTARELYLKHGYPERAGEVIISTINILIDRGEYDEAKKYMLIYEKESGRFDQNGNLIVGSAYYYEKGCYYLAYNKIDSALTCFYNMRDKYYEENRYKGLMSAYEKKHIPDSIAKYARLFADANDSSYLHVNQERVHQVSAMYNYSRHRRNADEMAHQATVLRHNVAIGIVSLLAIIFMGAFVLYKRRTKTLTLINQLIIQKELLNGKLAQQKGIIKDINHQHVLRQQQSNQQIEVLQIQVEHLQHMLEQDTVSSQEDEFVNCASVQRMKDCLNPKNNPIIKGEYWDYLMEDTKKFLPHFYRTIIQHKLTNAEMRTAVLVRLGFISKEIEILLDVSSSRVANLKKSASIKLFNDSNTRLFHEHILNI